jgi:uncharacterized membrane protein YqgA involved in biofilm formation
MKRKILTSLIALSLLFTAGGMTFLGNIRDARDDTDKKQLLR